MKKFFLTISVLFCCLCAGAQQYQLNKVLSNKESTYAELMDMDDRIAEFMETYGVKGMSLSIMRRDSLLFSRGYGWADVDEQTPVTPGTVMRVASVSKLVTAIGIMVLKERGKLKLESKVFGPDGILDYADFNEAIVDSCYYAITVENLLRHEGGFDDRKGDPMFSISNVMQRHQLYDAPNARELAVALISEPLRFYPGTGTDYSNFGYLLLSLIIEKVTGTPYETWMQKNVLIPAGCYDMHIAGNYLEDRLPNETRYYQHPSNLVVPEFNNSGRRVYKVYGGSDIRGLSGGGAWVASTPELARLVASIDGRSEIPDIISKRSVNEMTCYYDDKTYPLGWLRTYADNSWTRTGSYAGTSALIQYYPDGECWIFVLNTSNSHGSSFSRYTKALSKELREAYDYLLPTRNLFKPVSKKKKKR